MNPNAPRLLTWATLLAAAVSAVLLALLDPGMPGFESRVLERATTARSSEPRNARDAAPPSAQLEPSAGGVSVLR